MDRITRDRMRKGEVRMSQNPKTRSKFMKFLQFPLIRIFLGFLVLGIAVAIAQMGMDAMPIPRTNLLNIFSVSIAVMFVSLVYYGFVRLVERRAVTELSLRNAPGDLVIGMTISVIIFTITIGVLWAFGFYQVSGVNEWMTIIPGLVLAIFHGVYEELLIRGILFRIMEESLGTWLAMLISAMFFGALHLANPHATLWGAVAIAIEAGITLAAAFVLTRRLWIPIGIHFAWNFTQGFFGVAVSGYDVQGLVKATINGPDLLSGGAFGVEASVIVVITSLVVGIYFLWRAWKKGNFIKPFWRQLHSDADSL